MIVLSQNPDSTSEAVDHTDGVYKYAQEVLTYSLLYKEFEDASKKVMVHAWLLAGNI